MTISVCPIATVDAPLDRVWALLADPDQYSMWWVARTERIEPPGPAAPGQTVYATSRAFGRRWAVTTAVQAVDPARHTLDLRTTLPLGIVVQNHITCVAVDAARCRVSFG